MPEVIDVVAAVIYRQQDGAILLSKRAAHQHQGGKWEFPGGKVEAGESLLRALSRELAEELAISCNLAQPLMTIEHHYPAAKAAGDTAANDTDGADTAKAAKSVRIHFFEVRDWQGEARGCEGQAIDWVAVDELAERDFPAANAPLVRVLRWGGQLLVWPADLPAHWELRLHLALQRGVGLVYARGVTDETLLRDIAAICHQHGAALLVANDAELMRRVGADGVHLQAAQAATTQERPDVPLLSVACHGDRDLEQAVALGADFATLAPVNATPTHPDATPLGWSLFAALAKGRPLGIYALGGVGPASLTAARANGAYGVAGISAFWPPEQLLHGL